MTAEFWWITPYWLNVPSMHIAPYCPRGPGDREPLAGQVALEDGGAHVADRLLAARAVAAGAAVRDERADHVVAGLHPGHAGPDLLDDAGALVPEHHRQPGLEVAVRDVHVGVAQPGVGVPDQHLALAAARRGRAPRSRWACPASYTTAAVVFMRLLLEVTAGSVLAVSSRAEPGHTYPSGQVGARLPVGATAVSAAPYRGSDAGP